MRIGELRHERGRYAVTNWSQYGILSYGEHNDYPQSVLDVLGASVTGQGCLTNYRKFLYGNGFKDKSAWSFQVNGRGEVLDDLLQQVTRSLATFGGFALHLNFNRLYQIVSIRSIAFENVRLCNEGYEGEVEGCPYVALHKDWGKRYIRRKSFSSKDIEYFPIYDSRHMQELIDGCADMRSFRGAVYYYSNTGKGNYPLPLFDCALTDMNTEEAISNITNRNAKNGFLPAGVFVEVRSAGKEDKFDDHAEAIGELTGDKNANKVLYCQVESKEEIPSFVKIDASNYDKEFSVSRAAVADSIGRAFNQPPMLRAEKMSAGFSQDLMEQAFRFYNAVTRNERLLIERELQRLMSQFAGWKGGSCEVEELAY